MKRIIVEKKPQVNTKARELFEEFKDYLKISSLNGVRVLNAYDIFNATYEQVQKIVDLVLYEPQLDIIYEDSF